MSATRVFGRAATIAATVCLIGLVAWAGPFARSPTKISDTDRSLARIKRIELIVTAELEKTVCSEVIWLPKMAVWFSALGKPVKFQFPDSFQFPESPIQMKSVTGAATPPATTPPKLPPPKSSRMM